MRELKERIINYWLKLFPEFKDKQELENLFINMSGCNIEELVDKYIATEDISNNVDYYVDFIIDPYLLDICKKVESKTPFLNF